MMRLRDVSWTRRAALVALGLAMALAQSGLQAAAAAATTPRPRVIAPTPALVPARPSTPVRPDELFIQAKATEYDGRGHQYKVSGDVHMEVRDLKVRCAEALIYLSPDEARVDRIVFTGDVVAVRGRSTFRGDRVTYNVTTRKLVAEGNTRTRVVLPSAGPLTAPR